MGRTLYEMLEHTQAAAAALRSDGFALDPDISRKLARFEAAVDRALASSPDKSTVAHAEELVALDALCDLHVAARTCPGALRERLRPIVDAWIAYAASTGFTPQELASLYSDNDPPSVDAWIGSE